MRDASEPGELLTAGEGPWQACFRERFRRGELAETLVAFANGGGATCFGVSGRARLKIEGVQSAVAARQKERAA